MALFLPPVFTAFSIELLAKSIASGYFPKLELWAVKRS